MFHAKIIVTLRKTILDPQGKAVEHSIHSLGHTAASKVRMGKYIEMDIDVKTLRDAKRITNEVCDKLLANPVMEDFSHTIIDRRHKKQPAPKRISRKTKKH